MVNRAVVILLSLWGLGTRVFTIHGPMEYSGIPGLSHRESRIWPQI